MKVGDKVWFGNVLMDKDDGYIIIDIDEYNVKLFKCRNGNDMSYDRLTFETFFYTKTDLRRMKLEQIDGKH